jgi:hypothetical protein
LNIFGKWKTNSTATGPNPRSAHLHSRVWPTPTVPARPVCTTRVAHGLPGRPQPRSPLSGRASRRWRYNGGGGAKDGARAPTAERLPAGHGGGGDSSPELIVDGKGEENRIGGGVLRRGEGSGSRRRSCVGVEGEGGRLNTPRKKSSKRGLGPLSPWTSSRRWRRPDNDGGTLGQRRSALDTDDGTVGTAHARQGDSVDSGGTDGRAVGTPSRGQAGLVRKAAADRWAPLVSVFHNKNYTRTKIAQNK